MTRPRLLIAEDDADMRDLLLELLEAESYEAVVAVDGRAAHAIVADAAESLDLVVTDVKMPGVSGDELLAAVREHRPEIPVVVITAFGTVEQAVGLVKAGAFQYLTKPFATRDLLAVVADALEASAPRREHARLRREVPAPTEIVGASRPMRDLFELVARVAPSASTVLITGESGTGKELVARAVHEASGRRGAFVAVNCAAIPSDLIEAELFGHTDSAFTGARRARGGLFEAANGGTLFLDEVGDLPIAVQPKLLRALQEGAVRRVGADRERPVNVRIVAATNADLDEAVSEGRLRQDLYWRLNVIHLAVPPLRERAFDVPLLVEHFVARSAAASSRVAPSVSAEALAVLTAYSWPGNVRELENVIERAVALARGSTITPEDLPERVRSDGEAAAFLARSRERRLTLREVEREYIVDTLRQTGGNKSRAAELLGLDRKTLYRRLDEYRSEDPTLKF